MVSDQHTQFAKIIPPPEMAVYSPAKAVNRGIRQACDDGFKIVIKTDIDCHLTPEFIDQASNLPDMWGLFPYHEQVDNLQDMDNSEPDPRSCGTAALHAETWRLMNGYDGRMDGYGHEDGALMGRVQKAGYAIWRANKHVFHIRHPSRISPGFPLMRDENIEIRKRMDWADPNWGRYAKEEREGV